LRSLLGRLCYNTKPSVLKFDQAVGSFTLGITVPSLYFSTSRFLSIHPCSLMAASGVQPSSIQPSQLSSIPLSHNFYSSCIDSRISIIIIVLAANPTFITRRITVIIRIQCYITMCHLSRSNITIYIDCMIGTRYRIKVTNVNFRLIF